jgi:hypothetical protein
MRRAQVGEQTPVFDAAAVRGRRRRVRIAVAASLAVVATLAVAVAVAAWPDGRRSTAPPLSVMPTAVDVASARPADEVWPDAVVRLPRKLPDGRSFAPKVRLDDDRFVVVPTSGNAYNLPVVYDARARRAIELIQEFTPDPLVSLTDVTVSDRDIVMAVTVLPRAESDRAAFTEVWVAPRSGGPATRRAVFEDRTEVSTFGVGDAVFAAVTDGQEKNTTVYRLPAGGSPEQVARAEGVPHPRYGPWFMTAPFTFVDVATGANRTATVPDGLADAVCSPETCVGFDGADLVAYRFDGTNPARITGLVASDVRTFPPVITGTGRFVRVLHPSRDREYLWDRQQGVVAVVEGAESDVDPLQHVRYTDGEQYLLDLSRIA